MNPRRSLAALIFGLLTVAACTVEVVPNGGRLRPGDTSASGFVCPGEIFNAMTCIHEEQGDSCPSVSTCHCAGGAVLQKTSTCVCGPGRNAFGASTSGFTWNCADDCEAACAGDPDVTSSSGSGAPSTGSGTSSSGSSAPSTGSGGDATATCVEALDRLFAAGCSGLPGLTQQQIEEQCQAQEQMCGALLDAWSRCMVTSLIICDANGFPEAAGCDDQTAAYSQCAANGV